MGSNLQEQGNGDALAKALLAAVIETFAIVEKGALNQMRSRRFTSPGVWVYFRCLAGSALNARYHFVDGPDALEGRAVVLADISIDDDMQGQGVFTEMIRVLESSVPNLVYIEMENLISPRLTAHLARLCWKVRRPGWQTQADETGGCWYRRIQGAGAPGNT